MWSCESTAGTFPQLLRRRLLQPGFLLEGATRSVVAAQRDIELLDAIGAPVAERVGARSGGGGGFHPPSARTRLAPEALAARRRPACSAAARGGTGSGPSPRRS